MSAPISKSQMMFELPKLSYIDTSWEEPAAREAVQPARPHVFANWIAAGVDAFRKRRAQSRALNELSGLTDRELIDVGLNRADFDRIFDDRYNRDLRVRGRDL